MADYAAEDAVYDAAVKAEWGQWVANGLVWINGALAFTDGSPVPSSTVERFNLEADGYVRKAGEAKPAVVVSVTSAPLGAPILTDPDAVVPAPETDAPSSKK